MLFDILGRVADGGDLLSRIVGDFDAEFLFEGHDQLDDVETVRTEIVDEAGFLGDLVGLDAEVLMAWISAKLGAAAPASALAVDLAANDLVDAEDEFFPASADAEQWELQAPEWDLPMKGLAEQSEREWRVPPPARTRGVGALALWALAAL